MFYLAQTDIALSQALTNGPVVGLGAALFVVATSGFALQRTLAEQLQRSICDRSSLVLILPYLSVIVGAVLGLACMFSLVGLPAEFTLLFCTPFSLLLGLLIWQRFLYLVITKLPGPQDRPLTNEERARLRGD